MKELIRNLNVLSQSCGAIETVIFEKTTFLLVAKSTAEEPVNNALIARHNNPQDENDPEDGQTVPEASGAGNKQEGIPQARANRFELISRLVKTFKNDTRGYSSEPFESLRMELAEFTLVLDVLTSTSYVLIIASAKEPRISKIPNLDPMVVRRLTYDIIYSIRSHCFQYRSGALTLRESPKRGRLIPMEHTMKVP